MNRNFKLLFILLSTALISFSCTNKSKSKSNEVANESTEIVDEHNSKNSLDWAGIYSAVLPCADCEGIETELIINDDKTYALTTRYMGVEDPMTETIEGDFVWTDGFIIKLEGIEEGTRSPYFKIEENRVRYLDIEGNEITGDMANFYVLEKEGNPTVEDKKWQLVELNGKEIENSNAEDYFLIFNSKERVAYAKANCNSLSLNYKIKQSLRVNFEQGMMTLMACPDENLERELLEILDTVDNLSTDGETMTLNKARMTPLAKFVLVKE